jgi:hypothetical protein
MTPKNASTPQKPSTPTATPESASNLAPTTSEPIQGDTHASTVPTEPTVTTNDPRATASSDERVAITVAMPSKLAAKVRLLASVTGKTISAIVLESVSKDVPPKLKAALLSVEDDLG